MKKITIFLSVFFCLLIINISRVKAQCTVVGIDTSGSIVTIAISCEFPVFINTGNELADNANYKAQKEAWITSAPEDYAAVNSLTDIYFEIHEGNISDMSAEKRAAIAARSELYHIIQ